MAANQPCTSPWTHHPPCDTRRQQHHAAGCFSSAGIEKLVRVDEEITAKSRTENLLETRTLEPGLSFTFQQNNDPKPPASYRFRPKPGPEPNLWLWESRGRFKTCCSASRCAKQVEPTPARLTGGPTKCWLMGAKADFYFERLLKTMHHFLTLCFGPSLPVKYLQVYVYNQTKSLISEDICSEQCVYDGVNSSDLLDVVVANKGHWFYHQQENPWPLTQPDRTRCSSRSSPASVNTQRRSDLLDLTWLFALVSSIMWHLMKKTQFRPLSWRNTKNI